MNALQIATAAVNLATVGCILYLIRYTRNVNKKYLKDAQMSRRVISLSIKVDKVSEDDVLESMMSIVNEMLKDTTPDPYNK